jgi:hypothetical protein
MTIHVFSSALPPPRYVGCQTEKMRSKSGYEFLQTESAGGAKVPTFRYRMRRRSARLRQRFAMRINDRHRDNNGEISFTKLRWRSSFRTTPLSSLMKKSGRLRWA